LLLAVDASIKFYHKVPVKYLTCQTYFLKILLAALYFISRCKGNGIGRHDSFEVNFFQYVFCAEGVKECTKCGLYPYAGYQICGPCYQIGGPC